MNDIEDQKAWNDYLIDGTVLKNKLNITNYEELKETEKIITRKTLAKLYLKPVMGNFDVNHLLTIHKNIFSIIYPFAGKLRKCSLQKDDHIFCYPDKIEENLKNILEEMNNEFKNNISSIPEFAFKLARYYYELIYLHPFREGNGRSIRVFIREFVLSKSKDYTCGPLDLDYMKIDKNNLMLGTAQRYIYPSLLETEFMKGLVPLEKDNAKAK